MLSNMSKHRRVEVEKQNENAKMLRIGDSSWAHVVSFLNYRDHYRVSRVCAGLQRICLLPESKQGVFDFTGTANHLLGAFRYWVTARTTHLRLNGIGTDHMKDHRGWASCLSKWTSLPLVREFQTTCCSRSLFEAILSKLSAVRNLTVPETHGIVRLNNDNKIAEATRRMKQLQTFDMQFASSAVVRALERRPLEELTLQSSYATEADASVFATLAPLRKLNLNDSHAFSLGGSGLPTSLRELRLNGTIVTDDDLIACLPTLRDLEYLSLSGNSNVGDASWSTILQCQSLYYVEAQGTAVTQQVVAMTAAEHFVYLNISHTPAMTTEAQLLAAIRKQMALYVVIGDPFPQKAVEAAVKELNASAVPPSTTRWRSNRQFRCVHACNCNEPQEFSNCKCGSQYRF
jgi:hypothetical protein